MEEIDLKADLFAEVIIKKAEEEGDEIDNIEFKELVKKLISGTYKSGIQEGAKQKIKELDHFIKKIESSKEGWDEWVEAECYHKLKKQILKEKEKEE